MGIKSMSLAAALSAYFLFFLLVAFLIELDGLALVADNLELEQGYVIVKSRIIFLPLSPQLSPHCGSKRSQQTPYTCSTLLQTFTRQCEQ
jgi:hypothetical protein